MSSMSALLAVVDRAAETNLLLAEDYLARNAVGDQGAPEGRRATGGGRRALRLRFGACLTRLRGQRAVPGSIARLPIRPGPGGR